MTLEPASIELRCPTCGAKQELVPECRRCKCDLTLVTLALRQCHAVEQQCAAQLGRGEIDQALGAARKRWNLAPDEVAARYLAVCYALQGRFQAALDVASANPSKASS